MNTDKVSQVLLCRQQKAWASISRLLLTKVEKKLLGSHFSTQASLFLTAFIAGQTANVRAPEGALADCHLSGTTPASSAAPHSQFKVNWGRIFLLRINILM